MKAFRFRLKILLVLIAFAAILLTTSRTVYVWYTSIQLSDAVDAFNSKSSEWPKNTPWKPLTVEEIVTAIESQIPTLKAEESTITAYRTIARTLRIPRTAQLSGFQAGNNETHWAINLDIMTGPNSGYGLRIRESGQPTIKLE